MHHVDLIDIDKAICQLKEKIANGAKLYKPDMIEINTKENKMYLISSNGEKTILENSLDE